MRTQISHRLVLIGLIVVFGCAMASITGAGTEPGQLSLADIVNRLLGLEKRVDMLEERLKTLEQEEVVGASPTTKEKPMIEVISPKNGDEVGMNVVVEGIVHVNELAGRFPVVAVHPLLTNLLWIQPLPVRVEKTHDGYRFRCRAFCGTPRQGIGEKFEIYALLPEKGALKEGDQLDRFPKDVPVSLSVIVTRK